MKKRKRIMQLIIFTVIIIAMAFVLMAGCVKSSLYHPTRHWVANPGDAGLAYEDVYLESTGGNNIHGWYIPAAKPTNKTILAFHGNAGNISHRIETLSLMHSMGVNIFMIDYQGYGKSQGKVSEQATYDDAHAAWDFLTMRKNVLPGDIVIFGRSLGGAVAIYLAGEHPGAAGLIVESTFTSVRAMARDILPIPLLHYLVWNYYPSVDRIKNIELPTLIVHSPDDDIIPFEMGKELYELSPAGDKKFLQTHGQHNGGWAESMDIYAPAIQEFLEKNLKDKQD